MVYTHIAIELRYVDSYSSNLQINAVIIRTDSIPQMEQLSIVYERNW